ncbi:MAG: LLM class flavin-dependent oxidoreductase, partial [Actinomycetota bacterium]
MDIGVTLPNGAKGIPGPKLVEWGVRAEELGFAVAGVIGRTAYPTHEELITLAAVAGATSKIRLMPTVLVGPNREPVLLAKQAATLDRISDGRFILGIATGMREDDFTVTGTDHATRGKRLDEMLEVMHKVWRGEPLADGSREAAPPPTRGDRVPLMFGANFATKPVVRRIAKWGDGFIAAGSPQMVKP